jgi:tetratricopeptide (TPR) repeat protein
MKASQTATELGLVPRGQSVVMYSKDEPRELLLISYEITDEPEPDKIPKSAQRLLEQAHAALSDGEAEKALHMAEQGLKLVPDNPTFLNYLGSAHEMLGQREEANAIVRHTAALHPDYTFARTAMSKICVQEQKLDEADEWLAPLMQRSKFHVSEFRAFCDAQINLLVARGERESAQSWVRIWSQVDPDGQFDMLLRRYLK